MWAALAYLTRRILGIDTAYFELPTEENITVRTPADIAVALDADEIKIQMEGPCKVTLNQ